MQYNFLFPFQKIKTIHSAVPLSLLTTQHNSIEFSVSSLQNYNYPLCCTAFTINSTAQCNRIFCFQFITLNLSTLLCRSLLAAKHDEVQFSVSSSQHYIYPFCSTAIAFYNTAQCIKIFCIPFTTLQLTILLYRYNN